MDYDAVMGFGDRVRERRLALNMTQTQLSAAVKALGGELSQQQITTIEKGDVRRPRSLPELAQALRTTTEWLLYGRRTATETQPSGHKEVIERNSTVDRLATSPEALVIWPAALIEGEQGGLVLNKTKVGETTRPAELAFSEKAFAFRMQEGCGGEHYRDRDTLIIDPATPPVAGDDCLFVRDPAAQNLSTIPAKLVRITPEHWVIKRFVPEGAKDSRLSRSEWKAAWFIFGKYNRR